MTPRRRAALRWTTVILVVLAFIVVPFAVWGTSIEAWVLEWVAGDHPPAVVAGVVCGLLCADVLLPIPSSVVSVSAGIGLGTIGGTLASTVGMTVGCAVGHAVGRHVGRRGLVRFVEPDDVTRFETFAHRFGEAAVLLTRAVPVLAEASVIMAGAARVRWLRFVGTCAGANLIISGVYAALGDLAARNGRLELAIIAALALPGLAILASRTFLRGAKHESGRDERSRT